MAKITRELMQELRDPINDALRVVGAKYGITLTAGNGTFDYDGNFGSFKLEIATVRDDGAVMTKEATEYLRWCNVRTWCRAVGTSEVFAETRKEWLFAEFTLSGKRCMLLGRKSGKMPMIYRDLATGKTYRTTMDAVARAFDPSLVEVKPMSSPFQRREG